jgi:YD repeat-containing protein
MPQGVCYSYDGLGRLTGVINSDGEASFYEYDAMGNILSIRGQSPSGAVTVYSFDPVAGESGDRVEVFGIGFSPTLADNQVSIGGVQTTVLQVVACTLVVEIPAGDVSGEISVTTPLGTGVSSQRFNPCSISFPPTPPAVLIGTTLQFTPNVSGCGSSGVRWKVNDVTGGDSTVGTISAMGLYTAPGVVPMPATVTIRAESLGFPGVFGERSITVVSELLGYALDAASARLGSPALSFSAGTVTHSASARFGVAPIGFSPGVVLQSASVAKAPVILSMSPSSGAKGSSFTLTVTGANLAGASGLVFALATGQDAAITVTNVNADPGGGILTANVSIAPTASTGTRTLIVLAPAGNSTSVTNGADSFSVGP